MYYKLISFNSNENSKKGNQQNDAIKCIKNIVKQKNKIKYDQIKKEFNQQI